jgi:hypothetical protein
LAFGSSGWLDLDLSGVLGSVDGLADACHVRCDTFGPLLLVRQV